MRNSSYGLYENIEIDHEFKLDRELSLEYAKRIHDIQHLHFDFKHDREIVELALEYDSSQYQFASQELQNDREIVMKTLRSSNSNISLYEINYRPLDWELCYEACKSKGSNLKHIPEEFQNDEEIVEVSIYGSWQSENFQYASDRLKNDKLFVSKLLNINPLIYQYIAYELKNDRDLLLQAITKDGIVLKHAHSQFKKDREIVLKAMEQNKEAFYHASNSLQQNDRELFEIALRKGVSIFSAVKSIYNNIINKEIALEAIGNDFSFILLPCHLRNDYEIALKAVNRNVSNLAHTLLKNDRKFLLEIEPKQGLDLLYVPLKFRSDREIGMKSVKTYGKSFKLLSKDLQLEFSHDREIMLMGIRSSSSVFLNASSELQQDYQFILKAIELNGQVLEYLIVISPNLYLDRELVLKSVQSTDWPHIPLEYLRDREINLKAVKKTPGQIFSCNFEMQMDLEIAISSTTKEMDQIYCLPIELRSNKEFITKCMEINVESIASAHYSLRYDKEYLKELNEKFNLIEKLPLHERNSIDFKCLICKE